MHIQHRICNIFAYSPIGDAYEFDIPYLNIIIRNMKNILTYFALCTILINASYGKESLFDWTSTNAQILAGSDYELGDQTRQIITLEHANGWKYGSNFLFLDISEPFDDDTDLYGEFYTFLSFEKIFGNDFGDGLIKDVSLTAGTNLGEDFRAYLGGIMFDMKIPGFDLFQLQFYAFDNKDLNDTTYQITPVWDTHFNISSATFRFKGFTDFIGEEGTNSKQILSQPQLLLDLGSLKGSPETLYLGLEYQYWKNKFGIEGVTESMPQVILVLQF